MDELNQNSEENFFPDKIEQNNVANIANVANVDKFDLSKQINPLEDGRKKALDIIDGVLSVCTEQPELLASPDFIQSVQFIREHHQGDWLVIRCKIKDAKPSGVPLADIDSVTRPASELCSDDGNVSAALIKLVTDSGQLIFDPEQDRAYLSVQIKNAHHLLSLESKAFIDWLSASYYFSTRNGDEGVGKSASEQQIKQARFALSGIAKHDGKHEKIHLRAAQYEGAVYIYLGDDQRRLIEVLPTGWRLIESDKSPVKFWQPSAMQSLPVPSDKSNLMLLWDFLNIPENDRLLVLAWILETFRPETPFPILALSGQQGCAKSSTQNKIRQLIDHNSVNLRAAPKTVEDIFVSAGVNWLSSFENISNLSPSMQDALCTLATGGGFAARKLFTNAEESVIEVKRPVIINSIPNVVTAQDLTDRAISIELPRIEYREESEISQKWEDAKPAIMAGLMDLFVDTLARLDDVVLVNPPRMADFTRLGEAMSQALGYTAGSFDKLYKANRLESVGRSLEGSPVASAIIELADSYTGTGQTVFHNTVKALFEKLTTDHRHNAEAWPRGAKGLACEIKRQQPALLSLGIEIIQGKEVERIGESRGLPITIKKSVNVGNVGNVVLKDYAAKEKFDDKGRV